MAGATLVSLVEVSKWFCVEQDGATAVMQRNGIGPEALVGFDAKAARWSCSTCGLARPTNACLHVQAFTRDMPAEVALKDVLPHVQSGLKPRAEVDKEAEARRGRERQDRESAEDTSDARSEEAAARRAAVLAERDRHAAQQRELTQPVTVRQATPEEVEARRARGQAKSRGSDQVAPPARVERTQAVSPGDVATVRRWVGKRCIESDPESDPKGGGWTAFADLHADLQKWLAEDGKATLGASPFGRALTALGYANRAVWREGTSRSMRPLVLRDLG
jgi:hypothetical protein